MNRIPQLDGLRGFAVLLVFVYHGWQVPLLWSGVDLFFVLSGFLITGILLRLKETKATTGYWRPFYLRRICRILPPYVGFMVFLALCCQVPWAQLWPWYAFFAANLASLLGSVPVPHEMVPLWSLAVEEQFYFLWPWVVLFCRRDVLKRVTWAILLGAPLLRLLVTAWTDQHHWVYMLMPCRADLLAGGALVALIGTETWVQDNRQRSLGLVIVAGGLLVGCSLLPGFRMTANTMFFNTVAYSLIVLIYTGLLVHALALREGWIHRVLVSAPLRYLGKISFTFYLYQVPVLDLVSRHLHLPNRTLVVAVGLVATAVLADLSWRLYEAPILRWGRKGGGGAREAGKVES